MNDDTNLTDPQSLSEEDLSKLGLREQPFLDHADEGFLYTDSQLEMTANIIMEYLTNPATTIVLTGENGLGKTTFLRKVLRLGYQQYQFCTLRASPETDFDYIEGKIKQRWVLHDDNENSSVIDLSIENYVITYLREHAHAVLIIDDAHLLDANTLDRLFTLKHRIGLACPLSLGFIIAGEGSLKSIISDLEDSNPACTQVYQINIRPFSYEQTKHYIEHRLAVAGLEDDVLFDDAKITEIYKSTSGNARQIHEHCIGALKLQCSEESLDEELAPYITVRRPKPKVPILFLTLVAILGVGLYFNYKFSNQTEDETTIPLETPLASEPTLSPISQESSKPIEEQTPSLPLPNTPKSINKQIDITSIQNLDLSNEQQQTKQLPSLLTESLETLDETQLTDLKETLVEKASLTTTDVRKQDASTAVEQIKENPHQTPKTNTIKPATSSTLPHGEAWLKTIDPNRYTLQVVATKDRKQLENLIKQEKLAANYAYFDKPVKQDTYYVLVIGSYENRDEAVSAANKLSASLRKNKPWPVPVKNVQKFLD